MKLKPEDTFLSLEATIRDEEIWALQQLVVQDGQANSTNPPSLCSKCCQMQLASMMDAVELSPQGYVHSLGKKEQFERTCPLCCLVAEHVFEVASHGEDSETQVLSLSATSFEGLGLNSHIFSLFSPFQKVLLCSGKTSRDLRSYREGLEESCHGFLVMAKTADLKNYFNDSSLADGPRSHFTQSKYRPALVRTWMDQAGILDKPAFPAPNIAGMRVIDCEKLVVVDLHEDMEYLALSYVWSLSNQDMVLLDPLKHTELDADKTTRLPSTIPRVVSDAVTVTLDLGHRYLWVDQYCINQSVSKDGLIDQISRMDEVYMSAKLTIIAASTSGALPGVAGSQRWPQVILNLPGSGDTSSSADATAITVFTTTPTTYDMIKQSLWYQRGWCYQESVLSEARLYFTDHETLFQAPGIVFSDTYPEAHEHLDITLDGYNETLSVSKLLSQENIKENEWANDMFPADDPRGLFWAYLGPFIRLLEVFRGKNLTHESDSINAFKGVLKYFSRVNADFGSIAGIPIFLAKVEIKDTERFGTTSEPINEICISPEGRDQPPGPYSTQVASDTLRRSISSDSDQSELLELTDGQLCRFQHAVLTAMLLWRHDSHDQHEKIVVKQRPSFPSWSWAGWTGKIMWDAHRWDFNDDSGDADDGETAWDRGNQAGVPIKGDSGNQHTELPSSSASSRGPGWRIDTIVCKNGRVLSLRDWSSVDIVSSQHFDDAYYLVGEAFSFPPEKLMLMHSLSKLSEMSKLYNICLKVKRMLWKTYILARKFERAVSGKEPSLLSRLLNVKTESIDVATSRSILKWPGSLPFRRKLYRLTRMLPWSILHEIFNQLRATEASFSLAGLANLPLKSSELEDEVRRHLDDGSWGLLMVNAEYLMVVEWTQTSQVSKDGKDNRDHAPRTCSRVGLIDFTHYLVDDPEAKETLSKILQKSPRISFCMQ